MPKTASHARPTLSAAQAALVVLRDVVESWHLSFFLSDEVAGRVEAES